MENKIYVEMTIDELNAFKEFKENDISTEEIIKLLKNRCATLNEDRNICINPNTMEKCLSDSGTIYLNDDSKLYFCYTRKADKYEH
jgi:hypothetical protein